MIDILQMGFQLAKMGHILHRGIQYEYSPRSPDINKAPPPLQIVTTADSEYY